MEFIYVTGCDTGFGNILTKKLDKLGYGVFPGCYLAESVQTLKEECSDRVVPLQLDVTKEDSVQSCAARIEEELAKRPGSKLIGLVNNAGILVTPGPVEFTPIDAYRRMMDVNFFGMVMVTKSVLKLIRHSQGRIVNVASAAGRIGLPSQPAYSASKFAVEAFSDVLRRDMLEFGVSVHIMEPGVFSKTALYANFQTDFDKLWEKLPQSLKDEYGTEYQEWYRRRIGLALTELGNVNSELVPNAMVEALTSKRPKYRYRVGIDSKYIVTLVTWLPEGLQDKILTLENPKNPNVLPKSAPKNGTEICASRYKGPNYKLYLVLLAIWFIYRRVSK